MAKGSVNGSAKVSNISDTVARVTVSGSYSFGPWYYWGVRVRAYANGQEVASAAGYTTSTYKTTASCEGYLDVPRGTSDYTLTWKVTSEGETVSGYGPLDESDSTSGSVTIKAMPVYAPEEPTEPEITRDSDNQVTLSWTNNVSATKPYAAITVYRAANGGEPSEIATLAGNVETYVDQTTSADSYYTYTLKASNSAGNAGVDVGTVYMTPAAPTSIEWAREQDTNVTLTIANTSNTATALEIESRPDGSDEWTAVSTVEGVVTQTTVSLGGGQFYVRVRNTRGDLVSDWLESDKIVTLVAPNAPTLASPASSAVVRKDASSVALRWTHNPLDGSTQTAAEVRYKVGSGSYTTQTVTTAQSYSLSLASIGVNSIVTWQVRTKGAHADFSPWSSERSFSVRQVPTVSITAPTSTIEATPVVVAFSYNDPSGSLRDATVTVKSGNETVFTKRATSNEVEIGRNEYLFQDGQEYGIAVTANSTSTLQASANSTFTVKYSKPVAATVSTTANPETGAVSVYAAPNPRTYDQMVAAQTNANFQIGASQLVFEEKRGFGVPGVIVLDEFDVTPGDYVCSFVGGEVRLGQGYIAPAEVKATAASGVIIYSGTAGSTNGEVSFNFSVAKSGKANIHAQAYSYNPSVGYNLISDLTVHRLSEPLGEKDRLSELAIDGNAERKVSRNLISEFVEGKYVGQSAGGLVTDANYRASGWIEVQPSGVYNLTFDKAGTATAWASIVYYDSNKEYISGKGEYVGTGSDTGRLYMYADSPSNAKYARCSWGVSSGLQDISNWMFAIGIVKPDYEPYYPPYVDVVEGRNLLSTENAQSGKAVLASTGQIVGASPASASDYIPVLGGVSYTMHHGGLASGSYGAAFFDNSKGYISGSVFSATASSGGSNTFTTPNNAAFAMVTWLNTAQPQLERGSVATPYVPYGCLEFRSRGKNLLMQGADTLSKNDLTFTKNDDGSVIVSGTASVNTDYPFGGKDGEYVDYGLTPGNYFLSGSNSGSSQTYMLYCVQKKSDGTLKYVLNYGEDTNSVVTHESGDTYRFFIRVLANQSAPFTFYPQLELGNKATPYEPYTETRTTIDTQGNPLASLPDGTRDELTVDENGHVQLVKRVGVVDLGTLSYTKSASIANSFFCSIPDAKIVKPWVAANAICSAYEVAQYDDLATYEHGISARTNDNAGYQIRDSRYSEVAEFVSAMSGVLLYYELAEPQTIDLGTVEPIHLFAPLTNLETVTGKETTQAVTIVRGGLPCKTFDIQRISENGTVTILSDSVNAVDYLDRYAPCNVPYKYRVVTYADSGAFEVTEVETEFETPYWYLVGANDMAKAKYNPTASQSISCADTTLVRFAGRRYPVLYEGDSMADSYNAGGVVVGKDNMEPFRRIQYDGGKAVYKSHDGDVIHVHSQTSVTRNMTTPPTYEVSVAMERIDGKAV